MIFYDILLILLLVDKLLTSLDMLCECDLLVFSVFMTTNLDFFDSLFEIHSIGDSFGVSSH